MDIETINEFFTGHLMRIEYFAFDLKSREAALRMAETDIAAELGRRPSADDYLELAAVGEQTIHLLHNPNGNESGRTVAEKVDGAGSRTYTATDLPEIAPRARRYLRALLGATVNVTRG